MASGKAIDRQEVHELIWKERDSKGRVQLHQGKLAETMGINPYHLNRIIRDFEAEGRLKKIASRYRNVGVYVVKDPGLFEEV